MLNMKTFVCRSKYTKNRGVSWQIRNSWESFDNRMTWWPDDQYTWKITWQKNNKKSLKQQAVIWNQNTLSHAEYLIDILFCSTFFNSGYSVERFEALSLLTHTRIANLRWSCHGVMSVYSHQFLLNSWILYGKYEGHGRVRNSYPKQRNFQGLIMKIKKYYLWFCINFRLIIYMQCLYRCIHWH
jgi:hypothetical protein